MDYITASHPLPCATIPLRLPVTKITDAYCSNPRRPLVVCDFSPPRGASLDSVDDIRNLDADFISVNYNPGRVPRADSAVAAHFVRQHSGQEVIFTLAVRDMNSLALQSHLLGAAALGLENLLIVGGDPFRQSKGRSRISPTELMRTVQNMNSGLDRRGRPLDGATSFCVGGVIDLGGDLEAVARLTHKKTQAGAEFFLTQPIFDARQILAFDSAYQAAAGERLEAPVFYGLQILRLDGVSFSTVPDRYLRQLRQGRSGEDIALEVWEALRREGVDAIYLIPTVGPRGVRDYEAAARFLRRIRH